MCPVMLLVAAALVGVAKGAVSQCWEHPSCQEVTSESSMMECIQLCRSLTNESPLIPGEAHLQPLPPSEALPPLQPLPPSEALPPLPQSKRSYSMEHFRWGKPVGRKRRPIKIYTGNGVEEESAELFPSEMRRRDLGGAEEEDSFPAEFQEKKDGTYQMKHFRWSGPPASKRYGGFMKSWDERSQRPLLTLFRNVINKDGTEDGQ